MAPLTRTSLLALGLLIMFFALFLVGTSAPPHPIGPVLHATEPEPTKLQRSVCTHQIAGTLNQVWTETIVCQIGGQ